jgi:hypothetical protein
MSGSKKCSESGPREIRLLVAKSHHRSTSLFAARERVRFERVAPRSEETMVQAYRFNELSVWEPDVAILGANASNQLE